MRTTKRDSLASVQKADEGRIIARNTFRYHKPDGAEVTRFHMTDIVERRPNGKVVLNSGGWKTMATKGRINDAVSEYPVYSERGTWMVRSRATGAVTPFYDGIVLPDAFDKPAKGEREAKKERKLKADIKKFVTATIPDTGKLPMPNNGDCWYCLMFDNIGEVKRDGLGRVEHDKKGDPDHLRNHIKEHYMTGSLIVNAMRWAGIQDAGIGYLIRDEGKSNRSRIRSWVTKYLKARLGLS